MAVSEPAFPAAPSSPFSRTPRERLLRSQLGMLFFLAAEAMFFAGLISAFVVLSVQVPVWPPSGQPRLPVEATGLNTLLLLWSGLVLFTAAKTRAEDVTRKAFVSWLAISFLSGTAFLLIQGHEWLDLVRFGLATNDSVYAGLFYVVVGVHGLHVAGGVAALGFALAKALRHAQNPGFDSFFAAVRMYWYFVVGVWPILYALVYLR